MNNEGSDSPVTTAHFGDVLLRIDAGWSPLCKEEPPSDGEWGILKVSAITSGVFLPRESKALLPGVAPRPDIEVKNGDIVICRANGAKELVGSVVLVSGAPPKLMLSDKTLRLVADPAMVYPRYLYHYLTAWDARRQIALLLSGSTGQSNISQDSIRSLQIALPHLELQRRIAEILDAVDASVRARQAVTDKVNIASDRFVEAFLSGHSLDASTTEVEGRMLESMARSDRPILKTGPFGSSLKGDDWVEQGVPVVTIGSLRDGYISKDELLYVSTAKAKILRDYQLFEGDIVFSRVADVGRSAVVTRMQSGWIMSSNLTRITVDSKVVIPSYVQLVIAHYGPLREQIRRLTNGSGREVVNDSIMRQLKLPWVPIAEQRRLLTVIDEFKGVVGAEERARAKLEILKRGLIDDLLTGRVRVTSAS